MTHTKKVGQLPYRNILCVTDLMGIGNFFSLAFPLVRPMTNIYTTFIWTHGYAARFFRLSLFAIITFFRLFHKEKVQLSAEGRASAREMETKSLGYTQKKGGLLCVNINVARGKKAVII